MHQAEEAIVVFQAGGQHALTGSLLGLVEELEGAVRQFEAGGTTHAVQRHIPVKLDLTFLPQVTVELLDLPGAVSHGGVGVLILVHGDGNGVVRRVGDHLVHGVTVFAIDVMGHDNLGLVLAVQLHKPLVDVLAAGLFVALARMGVRQLHGLAHLVARIADDGIVAHAHVPQTVEQLGGAGGVGAGVISHHHIALTLGGVGGNRAAEEDQLIVRVGGDEHELRLFAGGLPVLHPVRLVTHAQDEELVQVQLVLLAGGDAQTHIAAGLGQGHPGMQICRALHSGLPLLAVLGDLHLPGFGQVAEAGINAADQLILGGGDRNGGVLGLVGLPIRGVLLIGHLGVLILAGGGLELALVGDVCRLDSQRAGCAQHQQRRQQRNEPLFHDVSILPWGIGCFVIE